MSSAVLSICILFLMGAACAAYGEGAVIAWGANNFLQVKVPDGLTNVIAVAGGERHSVALRSDGTVVAWGDDFFGQTTVPLEAQGGVKAISAGRLHTVALKNDGSVMAWGWNYFGQTNVPVAAQSGVKAISAGNGHTVALKEDGSVVSWGYRLEGQLDVPAAAQSGVIAIAAGGAHTVALKENGSVVAWGRYDYGQTNVPVAARSGVIAIAAGDLHSVALKSDGRVIAWGAGTNNTGYPNSGQSIVPEAAQSGVTAIAAGEGYTVALKNDGSVVAWGTGEPNNYGQTTVPAAALSGVTAIAAGESHILALVTPSAPRIISQPMSQTLYGGESASFTVFALGYPLNYQWREDGVDIPGAASATYSLGLVQYNQRGSYTVVVSNYLGSVTSAPPAVVTVNAAVTNVAVVAEALDATNLTWRMSGSPWEFQRAVTHDGVDAAQSLGCLGCPKAVLETDVNGPGVLSFWTSGQGGGDDYDGLEFYIDEVYQKPYVALPVNQTVTFVIPGGVHTLKWTSDCGSIVDEVSFTPGAVLPTILPWGDWYPWDSGPPVGLMALSNPVALAPGFDHTLALDRDGTVKGWGNANIPAGLADVIAIAVAGGGYYSGANHPSLALKADGTVVEWNEWGLLTNAPANLAQVVAIAEGFYHGLALKNDGSVVAWGDPGYTTFGQTHVPKTLTNVVAIAAGGVHSLALKGDGKVVAWGRNNYGQADVPTDLTDVVAIAAGSHHSLALRADGTIVAWGGNDYGQLVLPAGLSNVIAVAAGDTHSLALRNDGTVVAWGDNIYGQTAVPQNLTEAVAIAAGPVQSLALLGDGPPLITEQPLGRTAFDGNTVHIRAYAIGALPLRYQWQKNGIDLPGATNSLLTLVNAQSGDIGTYTVLVSNSLATATSRGAVLTLGESAPFDVQAASRVGFLYGSATLSVTAGGSGPFAYQWRSNGVNITGATNANLVFNRLTYDLAGNYSVVVSNRLGAAGAEATLSIVPVAVWGDLGYQSFAYEQYIPFTIAGGVTNIAAVSARYALLDDGRVFPWRAGHSISNVVAIAPGESDLFLLKDGSALQSPLGTPLPELKAVPDFTNIVAVAAGYTRSLGLRADGTVVAEGDMIVNGSFVPATVPTGLTNVIAIASGFLHDLALKEDGSVVGWGEVFDRSSASLVPYQLPSDMTNIVAIAAGWYYTIALRSDGTVVASGVNDFFATVPVPTDLTNVVAISVTGLLNLALKSDGSVIAWGGNEFGQRNVPAGLTNVIGIAAAYRYGVALIGNGSPVVTVQPVNRTVLDGDNLELTVMAVGQGALSYQWQRDGASIVGATSNRLPFTNVQLEDFANYTCIVSNALGSVTSRVARLTVLLRPRLQPLPESVFAAVGESLTLSANATGTPPLRYQWRKNGANIPGATNATFIIPNARISDGGSYTVVVANDVGVATSPPILVIVEVPQQPPGDNFADRVAITGLTNSISGTNRFATKEAGERNHAGKRGGKSVWYSWQAPTNGIATCRTVGSTFDTLLGIYTNDFSLSPQPSLLSLKVVAEDEDRGGFFTSEASFNAVAGTNYYIAIDGFAGADGNFVLSWELEPTTERIPVVKLQPAGRTALPGTDVLFAVQASGRELTYQWLFNGAAISGATSASFTRTNVQAAHVGFYSVRVRNSFGREAESLPAALEIGNHPGQPLSEDKVEDLLAGNGARGLAPASAGDFLVAMGSIDYCIINNTTSTTQAREPAHCTTIDNATRWLRLRPDSDGTFVIDTRGSAIGTVLAVHTTGATAFDLPQVACDDSGTLGGSWVRFSAVANRDYLVVADGANYAKGLIQVNWQFGVPPSAAGDAFDHQRLRPGEGLVLRAPTTNGIPPPQFQWFWNNHLLPNQTNAWLSLNQLQGTNSGAYTVTVSNGLGEVRHTTSVDVQEPLQLTMETVSSRKTSRLHLPAATNGAVWIEVTSDLADPSSWRPVYLYTNQSAAITWEAPTSNAALQFFRARVRQ